MGGRHLKLDNVVFAGRPDISIQSKEGQQVLEVLFCVADCVFHYFFLRFFAADLRFAGFLTGCSTTSPSITCLPLVCVVFTSATSASISSESSRRTIVCCIKATTP